jgi:hypothetical protein
MRHRNFPRGLLGGTAILGLVFTWVLVGCNNDGDNDIEITGLVGLTAENVAALGGLTFDFPDATIFGFPGESATLALGDTGTTFTLTMSGGTVINGTIGNGPIDFVSCRLTQNPAEVGAEAEQFDEEYNRCEATVESVEDIEFGDIGPGTVTLIIGRANATPVASNPEAVILFLHEDGTVTINNSATPI